MGNECWAIWGKASKKWFKSSLLLVPWWPTKEAAEAQIQAFEFDAQNLYEAREFKPVVSINESEVTQG